MSITFLDKFAANGDRGSAWLMGTGWGLLLAAFGLSLASQYASSRLHSWKRRHLDHCQTPFSDRQKDWTSQAKRLDRKGRWYGKATRWTTFLSGVALLGGCVFITVFAYHNAFKHPAASGHAQTVATEKKGLDYTPPPVPRPVAPAITPASPAATPQPANQGKKP